MDCDSSLVLGPSNKEVLGSQPKNLAQLVESFVSIVIELFHNKVDVFLGLEVAVVEYGNKLVELILGGFGLQIVGKFADGLVDLSALFFVEITRGYFENFTLFVLRTF